MIESTLHGPLEQTVHGSACANCSSRGACLPAGLAARDAQRLEALIVRPRSIRGGSYLYRAETELQSLFAVRCGSFKSCVLDKDGREQIMGFHLALELLGMDAIGTGKHICNAVALEDSEVCEIPFARLQQLSREIPALGHNLNRMISHEIGRGYGVMLLLGSMKADERLAVFLLNLSRHFLALGYSPFQFILRMTRNDIGSYLGLQLETVSRMFSRFQREGIISVDRNKVRLVDLEKLKAMVQGADAQLRDLLANGNRKVGTRGSPPHMQAGDAVATAP